jgi:hypothetical protein
MKRLMDFETLKKKKRFLRNFRKMRFFRVCFVPENVKLNNYSKVYTSSNGRKQEKPDVTLFNQFQRYT